MGTLKKCDVSLAQRSTSRIGDNKFKWRCIFFSWRFPDDPYDRVWDGVATNFFTLNTSSEVVATERDAFQVPSSVVRSAISESRTNFHLDSWQDIGNFGDQIFIVMHFAELQKLNTANESRRLNIYVVDGRVLLFPDYRPPYLRVDHKEIVDNQLSRLRMYNISIYPTNSSTLSYIINALESFVVRKMNESQTDGRDGKKFSDCPLTSPISDSPHSCRHAFYILSTSTISSYVGLEFINIWCSMRWKFAKCHCLVAHHSVWLMYIKTFEMMSFLYQLLPLTTSKEYYGLWETGRPTHVLQKSIFGRELTAPIMKTLDPWGSLLCECSS